MGNRSMSLMRERDSGAKRTRTLRFSPEGSSQSPASTPANAGRSDCATCPTVTPRAPASERFSSISSSGFCPLVESPMSTAPGTARTMRRTESAAACSCCASLPRSSSCICLVAPPNPLVNTATVAPPICRTSSRRVLPNWSCEIERVALGVMRTYTEPRSTAPRASDGSIPPPAPMVVNV